MRTSVKLSLCVPAKDAVSKHDSLCFPSLWLFRGVQAKDAEQGPQLNSFLLLRRMSLDVGIHHLCSRRQNCKSHVLRKLFNISMNMQVLRESNSHRSSHND